MSYPHEVRRKKASRDGRNTRDGRMSRDRRTDHRPCSPRAGSGVRRGVPSIAPGSSALDARDARGPPFERRRPNRAGDWTPRLASTLGLRRGPRRIGLSNGAFGLELSAFPFRAARVQERADGGAGDRGPTVGPKRRAPQHGPPDEEYQPGGGADAPASPGRLADRPLVANAFGDGEPGVEPARQARNLADSKNSLSAGLCG
jgi:hypothetical protein